jgi:hypothetical protein
MTNSTYWEQSENKHIRLLSSNGLTFLPLCVDYGHATSDIGATDRHGPVIRNPVACQAHLALEPGLRNNIPADSRRFHILTVAGGVT